MSKQSEAKDRQGYTKTLNTCSTCANFTCDREKAGWNRNVIIERNLRCSVGGFAVNKTATCNIHTDKLK